MVRYRPIVATLEERFWQKVRQGPNCWEWTASRNASGYGQIQAGPRLGRPLLAHRVSWELHNGPISDGMQVCHTCDHPPCVRPDHLFLGTNAENMLDMATKGRHVGTRRLTSEQAAEIRRRGLAGENQSKVAADFGTTQKNVSLIVLGKRWHTYTDVG